MNTFSQLTESLGWALLHFLWQGAAIALLLRAFLCLAGRGAPQVRYAASGAALVLMAAVVAGTAWWHWPADSGVNGIDRASGPDGQSAVLSRVVPRLEPARFDPPENHESPQPHPSHSPALTASPPVASSAPPTAFLERLRPLLPWLVGTWAAGVALSSLRLLNGWRTVRRWRLAGSDSIPAEWRACFAGLCEKLRVSRPVRLLSSASLTVPVVIGWLKPVVLVPAGLFSGIPAAQLEAILAHELAHVRRADWLVNLLQTVVETVLFYHPAVWWVSAQLRKEREHCCDDIAASLHGDTLGYARALTTLEELRIAPVALSAAGGSLLQRIRRLAGLPEERAAGVAWPLGILTAAALALALGFALPRQVAAQQNEATVLASPERDAPKPATREEIYIKAYRQLVEADKHIKDRRDAEALAAYRSAKEKFDVVAQLHPDWHPQLLEYRRVKTRRVIEALEQKLKNPAAPAAGAAEPEHSVGSARSAGKYELADGIKLQVTQLTSSEDGKGTGLINTATIEWYAGNGQLGLSWPIELTAGLTIDPIVWKRGGTALWIVRNGVVRKIDYTNAADVKETVFKKGAITDYGGAPAEVALEILSIVNAEIARLETELEIAVPAADSGERAKGELVIDVKPDGSVILKDKTMTVEQLTAQLAEAAKTNPKQAVIIRGHLSTPYEKIVAVLDATHKAGLYHVSFATVKPSAGQEKEPEAPAPKGKPAQESSGSGDAPAVPSARPSDGTPEPQKEGVSLTVLDAAGKVPLKEFRVIAGVPAGSAGAKDTINWQPHTLRVGKDGGLVWPLDKAYDEMALRVEADGYAPQVFNWIEKKKGPQDLYFQMVEHRGFLCTVRTPDGKIAPDAVVALAMVQRDAVIESGKLRHADAAPEEKPADQWRRPMILRADKSGNFTLPMETDPTAAILVIQESGVREMSMADFRKRPDVAWGPFHHIIRLQPWARVTGKVLWGNKPGAGEKVSLTIHRDTYGYPGIIAQYEKTTAAADGSFVFEKVLPGHVQLSCPIAAAAGNAAGITEINLTGRIAHTELKPGDNTVVIGGGGTAIKGRLTGRDNWDGVTFHFHPTAPHIGFPGDDEMWKAWGEFQKSPEGALYFRSGIKVNADGTFEVGGVMPGDYQIFFKREGEDKYLASGKFTMKPETVQQEPLDIGEFAARP